MYNELFAYFREKDVEYKGNISLSSYSYVRIGGIVTVGVFPDTAEKLILTLRYLHTNGFPFCVIGKMTNLLANDGEYNGVAVFTHKIDSYRISEQLVSVACGTRLSRVISELSDHSLGGLEALFGIPGTVGGMIYSNAGAFGSEISDFLVSAQLYDIKCDRVYEVGRDELRLSYRHSSLKENKHLMLLEATLLFSKKDSIKIKEDIKSVSERRRSAQPLGEPSLGSAFKRCASAPVSKLIDDCGLKGYRVGGAEISSKHAGFIVNRGGATADDYKQILLYVKERIFQKYGMRIEEEIEFLEFLPLNIT